MEFAIVLLALLQPEDEDEEQMNENNASQSQSQGGRGSGQELKSRHEMFLFGTIRNNPLLTYREGNSSPIPPIYSCMPCLLLDDPVTSPHSYHILTYPLILTYTSILPLPAPQSYHHLLEVHKFDRHAYAMSYVLDLAVRTLERTLRSDFVNSVQQAAAVYNTLRIRTQRIQRSDNRQQVNR